MSDRGLKALAGKRATAFGHFVVEFATPGIGHIMKSAGCDFVLFDLEHSGFGFETVKSAMRYFEAADLPAIVRAPSKEYHHIARACDMGAEGVMLPMVSGPKEARHILDCMKYTPDGKRGVALQVSPPFVVTEDELAKVVDAIAASLREVVPALSPTGL